METPTQLSKLSCDNQSTNRDSSEKNNFINHNEISELFNANIYPLLSNIQIYNIIFQNKKKNKDNKIFVFNKSIQKILKLANVDEDDVFSFILFYLNEINLEAIGENKDLYNIKYNDLMNIINYIHIRYKNNDIKIHKSSLKKIIDLCGLIREEKFKYMNFQGIEEEKEDKFIPSSFNYKEEDIKPKKILKNKNDKNSKNMDILKGKTTKIITNKGPYLKEELKEMNKNIIENSRNNLNYINYLLDSDEEDYENNLLERSFNILRSKKVNKLNQMNNIYNDTKEDTYPNIFDTLNNDNNLNMSLNDNINLTQKITKPKLKEKIVKKKKKHIIKRNNQSLYEI